MDNEECCIVECGAAWVLLVIANTVPSSWILSILKMEAA
jgi:hypothetical protein